MKLSKSNKASNDPGNVATDGYDVLEAAEHDLPAVVEGGREAGLVVVNEQLYAEDGGHAPVQTIVAAFQVVTALKMKAVAF